MQTLIVEKTTGDSVHYHDERTSHATQSCSSRLPPLDRFSAGAPHHPATQPQPTSYIRAKQTADSTKDKHRPPAELHGPPCQHAHPRVNNTKEEGFATTFKNAFSRSLMSSSPAVSKPSTCCGGTTSPPPARSQLACQSKY